MSGELDVPVEESVCAGKGVDLRTPLKDSSRALLSWIVPVVIAGVASTAVCVWKNAAARVGG